MKVSDFRSDTVTRPTPAMREAMARAEVGDDVLGDDPTVKALEAEVARILGKEAALYVPSGTMANAIALKAWMQEGEEVLLEEKSHIYNFESGHPAVISRVMVRPLPSDRGKIPLDVLREHLERRKRPNIHRPVPTLIALENTHNFHGGAVLPVDYHREVFELAREYGVRVHLDGARLWNAAVALGVPEVDIARYVDSVSVCFSKGLGAPVGSAVAGPAEFIARARRIRKVLGGGMRQAGIIAAGALHALRHHRELLADDHRRARKIAEAFQEISGLEVLGPVETNMVFVRTHPPERASAWVSALAEKGVLFYEVLPGVVRIVTHLDVDDEDVARMVEETRAFFSA